MTVQQSFQLALQHHQSGRLAEAEVLYRRILAADPLHADGLHQLGLLAHQTGRHGEAAELIGRSVALTPENSVFLSNHAAVLFAAGRLDEAIEAYRGTIALEPDYAGAHSSLGHALTLKGELDEAIAACRRAIELEPGYALAHNNLGNALGEQGRTNEAIAAFRRAIELRPDYAEACYNLGVSLRQKQMIREAVIAFRRAVEIKPDYPAACHALGDALSDLRRFDEAVTVYRQALQVSDIAETQNNLGLALFEQGHFEQSMTASQRALQIKPGYAPAWFNMGHTLEKLRRLDEAVAAYRRAIDLKPDFPAAFNNLGGALKDQGELDEAIAAYRQAIALKPDYAGAHSNLAYTLQFHPAWDARAIAEENRRWNQQHAEPLRARMRHHANDRDPERRLRIGYVSPDFRMHAESYFVVPLFEGHDRTEFDIHAYASVAWPDAVTERLRRSVTAWHDVTALSNEALAEKIRGDGIDILVDLTMHMAGNRLPLFARKPAPVQVTWLAYPGSTGLDAIDYRLTDAFMDPPSADDAIYPEASVRLPDSWCCYDPMSILPPSPVDTAQSGSFVRFGSLNNFCKLNGPVLRLWAAVLAAVPYSRLLLLAPEGGHREKLRATMETMGIAGQRLEFCDTCPRDEYLRLYDRIDIALDPLPYNGITTTLDALWMGVPVVSLAGETAAGRAGLSLLSTVGLPELATHDTEQFTQVATSLAQDRARLAAMRAALRERMEKSPLMDGRRFARAMQAAYREMWRRWCAGANREAVAADQGAGS
jgi:predicted O-linked N-acetylglucosamine transferase (SPINDLY family)